MRLISFGCSLTYGQYLEDNMVKHNKRYIEKKGYFPSKYAWPEHLANHLNIDEVINLARPGSSNKRILHTIQNFNFQENDIVFTLWSYLERYCIFYKPYTQKYITEPYTSSYEEQFGPWKKDKRSKIYYKNIYNEYDHLVSFYTYANYAKMFFDNNGIKSYQLLPKPVDTIESNWNNVKFLKTNLYNHIRAVSEPFNDLAYDKKHPGPLAHKKFAELIFEEIQRK